MISFDITETAIKELNQNYMILNIDGIKDKEGYERVSTARKHIKSLRVQVDKRRKELTEDALKHQRLINSEAKRITSLLEPIEGHLLDQEKFIDSEIERIKQEKIAELKLKLQLRIDRLLAIDFKFNGNTWEVTYPYVDDSTIMMSQSDLQSCSDEDFDRAISTFKKDYDLNSANKEIAEFDEKMKREEEQREREKQDEIIKQKRREQELEDERLADIAIKQQEEMYRLELEAKALADLEFELQRKKEAQENSEKKREEDNRLNLLEIDNQESEEEKNFSMRTGKAPEQKYSIQAIDGKKYFFVEICGTFSASGYYLASSEEEAEDLALEELHNFDSAELSFDFEQNDIQSSEEETGEIKE